MGLLREVELKAMLKENNDLMVANMRMSISDAVRAAMPAMPQPNTHQIARLTVQVEGLKKQVADLMAMLSAPRPPIMSQSDADSLRSAAKLMKQAKEAEKSAEDAAKIPAKETAAKPRQTAKPKRTRKLRAQSMKGDNKLTPNETVVS
jgi:Arc/MetJ-type ribon-helix-helix transcriptional regulator